MKKKFESAPTTELDKYSDELIQKLLDGLLGYKFEGFISDESIVWDWMPIEEYKEELYESSEFRQQWLKEKSEFIGFEIYENDYIHEVLGKLVQNGNNL